MLNETKLIIKSDIMELKNEGSLPWGNATSLLNKVEISGLEIYSSRLHNNN
jgi:hypothetical protein